MTGTKESCTCAYCRDGCTRKPGWFLPGEAEKAAALMGMTMEDFFRDYLSVDWWVSDPDIFLLSPAIAGEEAGTEFPGDPRGTCVFYKGERCQIHAAKPVECRDRWCGDQSGRDGSTHEQVAMAWRGHQDVIRALLGREPEAEPFEGGFGGLFGGIW